MISKYVMLIATSVLFNLTGVYAESYLIDITGGHASINFKIKHLGYSWLTGRFNKFAGTFNFDEKNPGKSNISLTVKTASIDSAHALRDTHLRGAKYLNVRKYPEARFVSTRYQPSSKTSGILHGNLNFHGVSRPVSMTVNQVGAGEDPWGGFRRGFETSFKIRLHDFGIRHNLGKASEELELSIFLEGIRDSSLSEIKNEN
jgi:polyisoprenoid-binding protein YceI